MFIPSSFSSISQLFIHIISVYALYILCICSVPSLYILCIKYRENIA